MVLWLHGWYVKDHKELFHSDEARVRQQVLSSSIGRGSNRLFSQVRSLSLDDTDYDLSDLKDSEVG